MNVRFSDLIQVLVFKTHRNSKNKKLNSTAQTVVQWTLLPCSYKGPENHSKYCQLNWPGELLPVMKDSH